MKHVRDIKNKEVLIQLVSGNRINGKIIGTDDVGKILGLGTINTKFLVVETSSHTKFIPFRNIECILLAKEK